MTICPIAIAVGCAKCPAFKVCPAKGILGDQKKETPKSEDKPKQASTFRVQSAMPYGYCTFQKSKCHLISKPRQLILQFDDITNNSQRWGFNATLNHLVCDISKLTRNDLLIGSCPVRN